MAGPPAGYSGTPLPQKLGIKAGCRLGLLNAPATFSSTLGPLPEGVVPRDAGRGRGPYDVVVAFVTQSSRLPDVFAKVRPRLDDAGGMWIAWPKKVTSKAAQKAPGPATDLTETVVREVGLKTGLVDNKVCAVDEIWSGLRFVVRLKDRRRGR